MEDSEEDMEGNDLEDVDIHEMDDKMMKTGIKSRRHDAYPIKKTGESSGIAKDAKEEIVTGGTFRASL